MALATAVEGSLWPPQAITWSTEDGTLPDLTGATITGAIKDLSAGTTRAIAGTLAVTDGPAAQFQWTYDAADVVAGRYQVQFNAVLASGPTPARTFTDEWVVEPEILSEVT